MYEFDVGLVQLPIAKDKAATLNDEEIVHFDKVERLTHGVRITSSFGLPLLKLKRNNKYDSDKYQMEIRKTYWRGSGQNASDIGRRSEITADSLFFATCCVVAAGIIYLDRRHNFRDYLNFGGVESGEFFHRLPTWHVVPDPVQADLLSSANS
jgi:hypothetical protein